MPLGRRNTNLQFLSFTQLLLVLLLVLLHVSMSVGLLMETAHAISILVMNSSGITRVSTSYPRWNSLHVGHAGLTIAAHIITLIIGSAGHHIQPPIGLANFFHVDLLFKNINYFLFIQSNQLWVEYIL